MSLDAFLKLMIVCPAFFIYIFEFYTNFPIFWYLNDFSTPSIKRDISLWSSINVLNFWHDRRCAIHAKTPSTMFVTEPYRWRSSWRNLFTMFWHDVLLICLAMCDKTPWRSSWTKAYDTIGARHACQKSVTESVTESFLTILLAWMAFHMGDNNVQKLASNHYLRDTDFDRT